MNNKIRYCFLVFASLYICGCSQAERKQKKNEKTDVKEKVTHFDTISDVCISAYFIQKGVTFPIRIECESGIDDGNSTEMIFHKKNDNANYVRRFLII